MVGVREQERQGLDRRTDIEKLCTHIIFLLITCKSLTYMFTNCIHYFMFISRPSYNVQLHIKIESIERE